MAFRFLNWIDVANVFWSLGMQDKHALRRHKAVFEMIADHAQSKPFEVDFNETTMSLTFSGVKFTERRVTFTFSRLHGKATMQLWIDGNDYRHEPYRPSPSEVKAAFSSLNEKKPKVKRAKRAATAII